ncbi:MAG TPA: ATP-binding protein [Candidatus Acidoferrum sp.]|nr:ATP-binding protein [Candidatus Acidoferrum sp.]
MTAPSQLHLRCAASPDRARPLRHALGAFLTTVDLERSDVDDVLTAVGEAVANVVEHAYCRQGVSTFEMELSARADDAHDLRIEVVDRGRFLERPPRPYRGFGLRIVRAIATEVSIDASEFGTRVRMVFDFRRCERAAEG